MMKTLHNYVDMNVTNMVGVTHLCANEVIARIVSAVKAKNDRVLSSFNFPFQAIEDIVNDRLEICRHDSDGYDLQVYGYSGSTETPSHRGELITFYLLSTEKFDEVEDVRVRYFLSDSTDEIT